MIRSRLLIGCAVLLAGCRPAHREFEIVDVRERSGPAPMSVPSTSARLEPPHGDLAPADTPARIFDYDLPSGWAAGSPAPLKDVDLRAPDGVAVWVTHLAGRAGGTLANWNRWLGQLGLEAGDESMLAVLPRTPLLGTSAHRTDLTSPDRERRLIGLIACAEGGSTFVRMSGSPTAVEEQIAAFDDFVASLRFALPDALAGDTARGAIAWTAPASWLALPASEFRLAHFQVAPDVQAWVTVLGSDGGGIEANVGRWCDQFGRDPLDPGAIEALPSIEVLAQPALFVDLLGPLGSRGMLGVICELGDRTVFVKMEGPSEAVRAQTDAFRSFCASLTIPE